MKSRNQAVALTAFFSLIFAMTAGAAPTRVAYDFSFSDFSGGLFAGTPPPLTSVSGSFGFTFEASSGPETVYEVVPDFVSLTILDTNYSLENTSVQVQDGDVIAITFGDPLNGTNGGSRYTDDFHLTFFISDTGDVLPGLIGGFNVCRQDLSDCWGASPSSNAVVRRALDASVTYRVIDLGNLPDGAGQVEPRAINAAGQVAGYSWYSFYPARRQAFLWDQVSGMQDLGSLSGSIGDARAFDLNDAGQVVGDSSSSAGVRAFLWDSTNGMRDLGVLPGGYRSTAQAINNVGQVVGNSAEGATGFGRGFLWDSTNGMQRIGSLPGDDSNVAYDINDAGQVVGRSGSSATGSGRAFMWNSTDGFLADLGVLSGDDASAAYGINDAGQVVGYSYNSTTSLGRAFLWDSMSGMQSLGVLIGDNDSVPSDINAAGQVVGYSSSSAGSRAFLWNSTDGMWDLNNLIDAGDPLAPYITLAISTGINDRGMIVALGMDSRTGAYHAYRLTPIDGRVIDTGPGPVVSETYNWLVGRRTDGIEQSLAAEFEVTEEVEVGSIELWMYVSNPGSFKFSIFGNGGGVPGAELYSGHFTVDEWSPTRWLGLNDLSWRLQPGTYWVAFEGGELGVMGGGGAPSPSNAPLGDEAFRANNFTPTWSWIRKDDFDIGVRIYEAGANHCTGNWGASSLITTIYGENGSTRDEDFGGAYYGDCRTTVVAAARDEILDAGGLVKSLASADIARGVLRLSGELTDRGELSRVYTRAEIRDEIVAHVSGGGTGTLTFTLNVWGEYAPRLNGTGTYYENVGGWSIGSGSDRVFGHWWSADSRWVTASAASFRDQISYAVTVTDGQTIPFDTYLDWQCIVEVGENCSFDLGNTAWLQITGSDGVTFTSASGELLSDAYLPESVARLDLLAKSVMAVGPGTSLADKVALASMYFEIPDIPSTCSTLGAFMNEVRAQSGKKIEAELAGRLTADAQRAWSAVGCQ